MLDKIIISDKVLQLTKDCEEELKNYYKELDELCYENSTKVINAFKKNRVSTVHFNSTTGYGYDDIGRETIEKIFAEVLDSEDALVRNQFISGSHALSVALFSYLRPGDIMLSITGLPYDTLHEVIGIKENSSSLKSFNIKYEQIDLIEDDFDIQKIVDYLNNNKVKLIEIQRSKDIQLEKV